MSKSTRKVSFIDNVIVELALGTPYSSRLLYLVEIPLDFELCGLVGVEMVVTGEHYVLLANLDTGSYRCFEIYRILQVGTSIFYFLPTMSSGTN